MHKETGRTDYMNEYNYSKELGKPISFGDINFEKPLVLFFMKLGCNLSNLQIKPFKAEDGLKKSIIKVPVGNNEKIKCTVIEPSDSKELLPAIIYLHGGAFVCPIVSLMIQNAAYYAKALNCRVYIPQYRLAPKYPFPIPLYDCYFSYNHIIENSHKYLIDKTNVLIYGDSAGGCLAASTCHMLRDNKKHIPNAQILVYPVTDNSLTSKSIEQFKHAAWTKTANIHMWNCYLKNGHKNMLGYAAPLNNSNFSKLPPAYVEALGIDTLRDEAIAYADKLRNAGISVEKHLVEGAYHGFDIDHKSPLVKKVLEYRVKVMMNYIKTNMFEH